MKKLSLLLLAILALPLTSQADGLLKIPNTAVEGVDGVNIATLDPVPKAGSDDDFAWWVYRRVLSAKKNRLVELSIQNPYKVGVKCLMFPDAFGFDTNDEPMTMNCFAGNNKTVSHVLTYQANIKVSPDSCNNFNSLKNYFNSEGNRTAVEAEKFVSQCWVQAAPVKFGVSPLMTAQKISADWLESELGKPQYENLRMYIQGSTKKKSVDKPVKSDDDLYKVQEAD